MMVNNTEQNILKGCGKAEINSKTGNVSIYCGDALDEQYDRETGEMRFLNYLCSDCKSKLEGYQLAQKETAEKVEKLIDELGETRNKDNSLSTITLSDTFTTNSIKFLKEELKKKLVDKIFNEDKKQRRK